MDFFGRDKEIERLREIKELSHKNARFTIITGRRRIGKTELVKQAYGEDMLYFFVARMAEPALCKTFVEEINAKIDSPLLQGTTSDFADVFQYVMELSTKQPITLFIDEFQEFFKINPSIYSQMQNIWDKYKSKSRINLIAAGSVNTLMNKIFRDNKEPLFGRQTGTMHLRPLETGILKAIMAKYCPDYKKSDLLALYAITGGVPKYVETFIDQDKFTQKQMLELFFQNDSYFLTEGKAMLIEEFGKDYGIYFTILSLIAEGKNTRSEIDSALSGKEVSGYLQKLMDDYDLIKKRQPLFEKTLNKNVRYAIDDQFLKFWFRFVYKYSYIIEANGNSRLKEIVERDFSTFSGFSLEHYFVQQLKESGKYTRLGYWHDRKGNNEIDIIAEDELEKRIEIIEVKRNAENIDIPILRAKTDVFLKTTGAYKDFSLSYLPLSIPNM